MAAKSANFFYFTLVWHKKTLVAIVFIYLVHWSLPVSLGCLSWTSCHCLFSLAVSPWKRPSSVAGRGCYGNNNNNSVVSLFHSWKKSVWNAEMCVWVCDCVCILYLARMRWAPALGPRPGPFPGEFFLTNAGEMEVVLWGTWEHTHTKKKCSTSGQNIQIKLICSQQNSAPSAGDNRI